MSRKQEFSILEYFGGNDGSRCGYCGSKDTNYSRGMWAHKLMTQDYQDLIDRGWRRSGKYVYKPSMDIMCCPAYTIRCKALEFRLSKSQKKNLSTVRKYLHTGLKPAGNDLQKAEGNKEEPKANNETKSKDVATSSKKESDTSNQSNSMHIKSKSSKPGGGPDPSKPLQKKAKVLRMEAKRQKREQNISTEANLESQATTPAKNSNEPKTLEAYLSEEKTQSPSHSIKLTLVRSSPPSSEFQDTFDKSYELYKRYQETIHKDPPDKCTPQQFKRFLCESPLEEEYRDDGPSCGYGSFHQQYWLDDVLVAVGVLDILPHCISSVYFYYNSDFNFLTLGTYSSLREIAFTREIQKKAESIKHYYMGFYIHSCPKMRYKGQIGCSYLLCPEAFTWQPIEDCRAKLDANKYSRLDPTNAADTEVDVNKVLTLHKGQAMPYSFCTMFRGSNSDKEDVSEYGSLVGHVCAYRMLLYRS